MLFAITYNEPAFMSTPAFLLCDQTEYTYKLYNSIMEQLCAQNENKSSDDYEDGKSGGSGAAKSKEL